MDGYPFTRRERVRFRDCDAMGHVNNAVYCRSGRMSAIAVRELARLGYGTIVELRGGMVAWEASGRRLLPRIVVILTE